MFAGWENKKRLTMLKPEMYTKSRWERIQNKMKWKHEKFDSTPSMDIERKKKYNDLDVTTTRYHDGNCCNNNF